MVERKTEQDYSFQNARRYSEIASNYSRDWRGELTPDLIDKHEFFLKALGNGKKTILDAGCGTGKASLYFAQSGNKVFSLDLSAGMLDETFSQKSSNYELNCLLANMKETLPFSEGSFDGVWSMAAIVHLSAVDRKTVLKEFTRVLKSQGILFLSAQNRLNPKHLHRIFQSYLFSLGYDEENNYYQHKKIFRDIIKGESLPNRLLRGYAFLDDRHWYFPTKPELKSCLQDSGLELLYSNPVFSKRIDILAVKP